MKENVMGGADSMDERDQKCIQNFCEKTWRKELGIHDNIKMDLKETGWEGVDWILCYSY
jgi:hypothetical protein